MGCPCRVSPRCQWYRLAVVRQHVFHNHGIRLNLNYLVTPVNHLTLNRDKKVLAALLLQKDLFLVSRLVGKAIELQRDGRRWRGWRRQEWTINSRRRRILDVSHR